MSISTARKFIVRGKSVDFRNREGSSPSIPKKGPLNSLILFILFSLFVNDSNFVIFLIHSIFSQTYPGWLFFTSLGIWNRDDIHQNEDLWIKQEIHILFFNGMINNPNLYSSVNLLDEVVFYSFFVKKIQSISGLNKTFE